MAVRGTINTTLADRSTPVESRHIRLSTGFIEKYEAIRFGKAASNREVVPTLNHIGTILLRSDQ